MKVLLFAILLFCLVISAVSQTYNIGSANMINTCSGTFYDNGGAVANYSNNFNDTITFCSNNNAYITVNFTSMDIHSSDNLYVYFGDVVDGTPNLTNPSTGLITSTCNCISFVFISDAATVKTGWAGTIGCTTPSSVTNDYVINALTPPLDGSCLSGQTNENSTSDISSGCFTSGNTVWYQFSLSGGNNTIDVSLQNASFANVQYLLIYDYNCNHASYTVEGAQCALSTDIVNWTDLREDQYWLGISSVTEGTFDLCITESYSDYCGDFFCGPGESCLSCPFDCGICPEADGGPYYHPVVGMQNTNLGQCMVTTCTGTYYDNGGSGATYANNINQVYRTFCPSAPQMAVQATISTMQIEYPASGCTDQLIIKDGPSQNSTTLWSGCGSTFIPTIRTVTGAYGTGVFTSTHTSGCLTFSFTSNASNTGYWEGWEIILNCIPYAAGPSATYNNDCSRAFALCNDYTVSSQVYGPGSTSEACGSCALAENFSEWYKVRVVNDGIMEFEISPLGNSDMDFAVYKADSCGELTMPIRCSHALYASPGKTGLSASAGDLSEDITGDQWVADLPVHAGEYYYIMVNEWNKTNPNSYTLDFNLSNGATFDCSIVLPVTFIQFTASIKNHAVELIWKTASETNNNYFTVERSEDGNAFNELAVIDGAGNSNEIIRYVFIDPDISQDLTYYRIKQTDFDGKFSYSQIVAVDALHYAESLISLHPNPSSEVLYISSDVSLLNKKYVVYNATGTEIMSGTIDALSFIIQTSDWEEGMYYFYAEGSIRHSFIVTHYPK